jgi:hypothetical protein
MRWAGHVARMGRKELNKNVLLGNLRARNHLEDLSVEERIILEWNFKKKDEARGPKLSFWERGR